jgi:cytochrome c-type biogenesis protein CcmH
VLAAACRREAAPPPTGRQAPGGLPAMSGAPPAAAPAPATATATATGEAVLSGTIDVPADHKAEVHPGDVIYVIARPAAGGPALAVDRLEVTQLPQAFRLTSGHRMSDAPLSGEVSVTARLDRDREAMTRQAGDLEGTVKATIPAKDLKIMLDTPVQP